MERCKDCIHYDVCKYQPLAVGVDVCDMFRSTADVVPKSEVDRLVDKWIGDEALTQDEKNLRLIEALKDEAKRYERYYFNHEYDKLIAEAKAEVAREIFADIETLLALSILVGDVFTGKYFDADLENDIAELKKKYTEKLK